MSISTRKNPPRKRRANRPRRSNAKLPRDGAVLITLPQSVPITGFGLGTTYKKARAGRLPGAVQIDGRWWVNKPKLLAWLNALGAAQNAA